MIVEEARASGFGTARPHPDLPGWQRILATDAAVLACETVAAALAVLGDTYDRALPVFEGITSDELERPFVLASWRTNVAPETTTLRRRVLDMVAEHLREHHAHLAATLARWQSAR